MSIAAYRKEIYFRARLENRRTTANDDDVGSVSTGATTGSATAAGVISYDPTTYAIVAGGTGLTAGRQSAQADWTRWTRGELPGSSGSLSLAGELLDDTNFFSQGWMSRIVGLRDWSITGSAFYQEESSDAVNPTSVIRQAWARRQPVQIAYLPDGNNGFYGLCEIETLDLSGDVNGLETFDFTFQANGPLYDYFSPPAAPAPMWPDGVAIDRTVTRTVANVARPNTLGAQIHALDGNGNLPPFFDPNYDAPAN